MIRLIINIIVAIAIGVLLFYKLQGIAVWLTIAIAFANCWIKAEKKDVEEFGCKKCRNDEAIKQIWDEILEESK